MYSPSIVEVHTICELYSVGFASLYWTPAYLDYVLDHGVYAAGFSGNIIFWWLDDAELLYASQLEFLDDEGKSCKSKDK